MIWLNEHRRLVVCALALILIIVFGANYWWGSGQTEVSYVSAKATTGEITTLVSGTGQVAAVNEATLQSAVAGRVVALPVKAGDAVGTGALLAQVDLGDAGFELETARLSYEDLITVDAFDLSEARDTVTEKETDLTDAFTAARAALTTASTDLADIVSGVKELLRGYLNDSQSYDLSQTRLDYLERANDAYQAADEALDQLVKKYRTQSLATLPSSEIISLTTDAEAAALAAAEAAKLTQDAVVYWRDRDEESTAADEAYASILELVAEANSAVSDLSTAKNNLSTSASDLASAQNDLAELLDGPEEVDRRASELTLRQKQEAYADHFIRAPFAGVVASVAVRLGQELSAGETVATVITPAQQAEIALNEVDVAKVKVGQSATLTFDALEELKLAGVVNEIDLVGTVSQGVVSYTVTISLTEDDERVKPGMTVSADIVTAQKSGVVVVPASAIKTANDQNYVEVMMAGEDTPRRQAVTLGLASDDLVEVVTGLAVGDSYVVRTIKSATTAESSQTAAPSILGGGSGNRPAGGGPGAAGMILRNR